MTTTKCEGCGDPATKEDSDNVPLCEPCFHSIPTARPQISEELKAALEDIDAYLETMPAKTDDWSIGYKAITPFVKSLRMVREQFEGRGDVISELLTEIDAIGELVELKDGESISDAIEALFAALESENERLKETARRWSYVRTFLEVDGDYDSEGAGAQHFEWVRIKDDITDATTAKGMGHKVEDLIDLASGSTSEETRNDR